MDVFSALLELQRPPFYCSIQYNYGNIFAYHSIANGNSPPVYSSVECLVKDV